MVLTDKVPNLVNICGIAIDLSALPVPSYSENGQPFYDSYLASSAAQAVYFGKRTVSFSETPLQSPAGNSWEVKATITFPNSDDKRALRIAEFLKARFLIVQLSGGKSLFLGRNDYNQNARPVIKIKSNEQLTSVEFSTTAIMPTGFLPGYNAGLLPHSVPVNLLNAS